MRDFNCSIKFLSSSVQLCEPDPVIRVGVGRGLGGGDTRGTWGGGGGGDRYSCCG